MTAPRAIGIASEWMSAASSTSPAHAPTTTLLTTATIPAAVSVSCHAPGAGAVAHPGEGDPSLAAQLEGHRHAGGHDHHVGEHRDHPHAPHRAIAEVDVAVAPAGHAAGAAHVLTEHALRRHAAHEVRREVTVQDAQSVLGGHRERRPPEIASCPKPS